jgi:GntR family histidine utilization transcriptional repressor
MQDIPMDKSHLLLPPKDAQTSPKPLYEQVKAYVLENIQSGHWAVHSQIPSEHAMVRELNMSRMTIHRALRELTKDGFLERIQGVGTFVARPKEEKTILKLADIKDTIERKGGVHNCEIKFLQAEPIEAEMASFLHLEEGTPVYRSYFIHFQNKLPVMLEDRFTNPDIVPEYLKQDFNTTRADGYFRAM